MGRKTTGGRFSLRALTNTIPSQSGCLSWRKFSLRRERRLVLLLQILGRDDLADLDSQRLRFVAQAAASDSENAGGLGLIAVGRLQNSCDDELLHEFDCLGIDAFRALGQTVFQERRQILRQIARRGAAAVR